MEYEKKQLMIELNNILESKKFSDEVKEKIKNVISKAYDSYTKQDDKNKHFRNVINSISLVDVFKINTRKQLNKIAEIKENLDDCTFGFVTQDKKMTVIVKYDDEDRTIYHEMIHLTQSKKSYYVSEEYPFSIFIKKCLIEGEASFYETDLINRDTFSDIENIAYVTIGNVENLQYMICSKSYYPFFEMIYKLLLEVFDKETMDKWKHIDYDIMPQLKEIFEKKYNFSFDKFYMILTKMIYLYFKFNKKNNYYNYKLKQEIRRISQDNLESEINNNNLNSMFKNIKYLKEEYEKNKKLLEDEKYLQKVFQEKVEDYNRYFQEYQQEDDYDPKIGEEILNEIKNSTIDSYKRFILEENEKIKNEYNETVEKYNQLIENIKKQQKNYYSIFDSKFYEDEEPDFFVCYYFILDDILKKEKIEDVYVVPKFNKRTK